MGTTRACAGLNLHFRFAPKRANCRERQGCAASCTHRVPPRGLRVPGEQALRLLKA